MSAHASQACSTSSVAYTDSVIMPFVYCVFGCQYQCSWLPGRTRLRNDLLYRSSGTFTHSPMFGASETMNDYLFCAVNVIKSLAV